MIICLFSVFLILFMAYSNWHDRKEVYLAEIKNGLIVNFQSGIYFYRHLMNDYFVQEISVPQVYQLVNTKENDALAELLLPVYKRMQNAGADYLQFYDQQGKILVQFTGSVGQTNQAAGNNQPPSGFDCGDGGYFYYNLYPVLDEGRRLGTVKIGVSFRNLLAYLSRLDSRMEYFLLGTIEDGSLSANLCGVEPDTAAQRSARVTLMMDRIGGARLHKALSGGKGAVFDQAIDGNSCIMCLVPLPDQSGYLVSCMDGLMQPYADRLLFYWAIVFVISAVSFIYSFVSCNRKNDFLTRVKVSKERELKRSELMQNALMENLPLALVIIDEESRLIEHVNSAAADMLGLPASELKGRICHDFICPAQRSACPVIELGLIIENSDRIILRYGKEPVPVAKTVRRIELDGKRKMLECFMDISVRKKAEEAILRADKIKSDFLANISHEIRTPLNVILGMTHLTLGSELSHNQREYLSKSYRAAKNLLDILNDILDFSRVESRAMTVDKMSFDLSEVLDTVVYTAGSSLFGGDVEFTAGIRSDVPRWLIGDPLKLGQVLVKLTDNAIKFTEHGRVVVWISLEKMEDDRHARLLFSVADTGIGIDSSKIGELFSPFTQEESAINRNYGGTGLGLSIANRIVELMGGRISVESRVGDGSTFNFALTFRLADKKELPVNLKGNRILIADSCSKIQQEVIMEYITYLNGEPEVVQSGMEMKERLDTGEINLLIVDSGLAGALQDRKLEIPAIILKPEGGQAADFGDEGMVFTVPRPVVFSVLVQAVRLLQGLFFSGQEMTLRPELTNAEILVVEDSVVNQQIIRALLNEFKMSAVITEDGRKAVEYLEKQIPDLILMDLQMPGMNGFETARKIRADLRLEDVPIIAMTASADEDEQREIFASGMNAFFTKPIEVQELRHILQKWLTPAAGEQKSGSVVSKEEQMLQINLNEVLPRFANQQDIFIKALKKAAAEHGGDARRLRELLEQNNLEEAAFTAHTLRGVMGNVGAEQIFELASRLEEACKQKDQAACLHMLDRLEDLMKLFTGYVEEEKYLAETSSEEPAVNDSGSWDELLALLRGRRPADCRKAVAMVKALAEHDGDAAGKIILFIEEYEFDKAIELVSTLYGGADA